MSVFLSKFPSRFPAEHIYLSESIFRAFKSSKLLLLRYTSLSPGAPGRMLFQLTTGAWNPIKNLLVGYACCCLFPFFFSRRTIEVLFDFCVRHGYQASADRDVVFVHKSIPLLSFRLLSFVVALTSQ